MNSCGNQSLIIGALCDGASGRASWSRGGCEDGEHGRRTGNS